MSDEKVCPFCAESIKRDAIKCRYCSSDLPAESPEVSAKSDPPEQASVAPPRSLAYKVWTWSPSFSRQSPAPARKWLIWAVVLYLVSGIALISGFTSADSSASYSCYEDPYCDEDDPANATPTPFPTGAVVFASLGSIAGTACLWVWIVAKGVETGRSTDSRRKPS